MSEEEVKRILEAVKAIKSDMSALRQAYADSGCVATKNPAHNPCPFCEDKTGFAFLAKLGARWSCFAGKCAVAGKAHSIIDFVMMSRKIESFEACKYVVEHYGNGRLTTAVKTQSAQQKKPHKTHMSVDLAIDACLWGIRQQDAEAQFVRYWQYTDAKGLPTFAVARFDLSTLNSKGKRKKDIRFIEFVGRGWVNQKVSYGESGNKLCPMYRLKEITKALGTAEDRGHGSSR